MLKSRDCRSSGANSSQRWINDRVLILAVATKRENVVMDPTLYETLHISNDAPLV